MNEKFKRIPRIFSEVVFCDSPAERIACLDSACGGDIELRAEVERLVEAHRRAGRFLERPAIEFGGCAVEKPGDRIGGYRLLEKVGEGGWGMVYSANRESPVRRRVALKIVKLGMESRSIVACFEDEQKALAMMDHPNIVTFLDSGATAAGRPFFVMEMVRGISITEYCDNKRLQVAERLKLFIDICDAVQYVHKKGVVHRDLKPFNVLVSHDDGIPKIIDFGIAKSMIGSRLSNSVAETSADRLFVGTPDYMSPEQALMTDAADIDPRSDVYSLGGLLYELLAGRTPFEIRSQEKLGFDEIRRRICDVEPPTPAAKLKSMHSSMREPKAIGSLVSAVRGELDGIVMRCLEKDPGRRYKTAGGLAADLRRHLNREPVPCPVRIP